jgi:hypothetical protein
MHDANTAHRRAPSRTNSRPTPTALQRNTMKKGITKLESGMRNEHWSTRIKRTSWQWKAHSKSG